MENNEEKTEKISEKSEDLGDYEPIKKWKKLQAKKLEEKKEDEQK